MHAVHWLLLAFTVGNRTCKQAGVLACLPTCLFLGCGCKGIYSAGLLLVGSVRGGVFLLLRGCPLASCMHVCGGFCCIVRVLLSAIVGGVCSLACFRSRSSSPFSLSFLLAVLLPVRVPSGSVLVPVAVLVLVLVVWFRL